MKKLIVIIWLTVLLTGIASLFWYQEWIYLLPTAVPADYRVVNTGTVINLDGQLPAGNRPVFLHFFNPGCPCSRFNIPHFRSLVQKYGEKASFAIVPVTDKDESYTAEEILDYFDLDLPVLMDPSLATACGVYSAPQAVIIGLDHTLYYRGNYNKSRFCTDPRTNFAEMAIDSLIRNSPKPLFDQYALRAYGCEITMCSAKQQQ